MSISSYQKKQQSLTSALVAKILALINPFKRQKLSEKQWLDLLHAMYVPVEEYRRRSAELARSFYDAERSSHVGATHEIDLPPYRFEWFAEAMQPIKARMMQSGTDDAAVSAAVLRTAKEVENGGRRAIMQGVRSDPQVKGWARVATGRETCGFCLMLISRGAVYFSAETAGIDADDTTAMDLVAADDKKSLDELMVRWHPGCDCKVVPVFDRRNWPGRAAQEKAEQLWINATKGKSGTDALNALRRALNEGTVDESAIKAA